MFANEDNGPILDACNKPLCRDCAKLVNYHNDVRFSDDGVPKHSDTTCSHQPTVTFSVGSIRQIIFERLTKDQHNDVGWSRLTESEKFDLENGCVFVLSPTDEKPCIVGCDHNIIHKTRHRVIFSGDGVSLAFVFRCVQKYSKFDPKTNALLWNYEDDNCQQKVEKQEKRFFTKVKDLPVVNREMEQQLLDDNISQFLRTLSDNGISSISSI